MSSRYGDRQGGRRSRSRSPDFRHKERRDERSRSNREEDERRHPHRQAVEQDGRSRQSRKNEDKYRTEAGSPQRKRERRESHPQRNYEKSRDGQEDGNRNRRDQSNENSRVEREDFLGNSDGDPPQPKEEPNFELSGKLTEYTNTYKGVVIKYNEPPEALKPKTRWRLYPFKGDQAMSVLYIHRQSAYLIGRQRHIADLAVDHPSCSKQHAVLQYRLVDYERPDGSAGRKCKPYIIDLESANGTFLNNQKIEARRYYELKEKDVLKFGFSSREYVLLNEKTKGSEVDDDIVPEEQPPVDS